MGEMVNPGNEAFRQEVNSRIYVDKTGLIEYTNSVCDTAGRFICNSRPRRFGKSYAADMLSAYYSRGCDSKDLFARYEISKKEDYEKYLNQCEVLHFDVQWCMLAAASEKTDLITWLTTNILEEMRREYPDADLRSASSVPLAMSGLHKQQGRTFVVIIDEWDAPILDDAGDKKAQDAYIDFLRAMFRGTAPMQYIRLAYLTGILPMKRPRTEPALRHAGSDSVLSSEPSPEGNFSLYTMIRPGPLAPYIGFTEEEVRHLCETYGEDSGTARKWYDGYQLGSTGPVIHTR